MIIWKSYQIDQHQDGRRITFDQLQAFVAQLQKYEVPSNATVELLVGAIRVENGLEDIGDA